MDLFSCGIWFDIREDIVYILNELIVGRHKKSIKLYVNKHFENVNHTRCPNNLTVNNAANTVMTL